MQGSIIPYGYAASNIAELEQLMRDERTYLVDIRLSPQSRIQAFTKPMLEARFPKHYIHMPELGNINYRSPEQGIQIASPVRGIERLVRGIRQGYTLVLMCGCRDYESCHRRTVVELLKRALPEVGVTMPEMESKQ